MSSIVLNQNLKSQYDKQEFFSLGVNYSPSSTNQIQKNKENFLDLAAQRRINSGKFDTPELAAAEEAAYARLEVSEGGYVEFAKQVISIGLQANFKFYMPDFIIQLTRTGPSPVSSYSTDAVIKQLEGAIEGLKDYVKSHENGLLNNNHLDRDYHLEGYAEREKYFRDTIQRMKDFQKDLNDTIERNKGGIKGSDRERESGMGGLADGRSLGERPEREHFRA